MFTKRTKLSKHVLNPESLEPGLAPAQVEIATKPELQLLHHRKTTISRSKDNLENSFATQFTRTGVPQAPLNALHVMRSVTKPEVEPVEEPIILAQFPPQPKTVQPSEASDSRPQPEDSTVVYMDERRARRLLREDATRQVAEALDSVGKVEAELVTTPETGDNQLIPDLDLTEVTPLVVTARENVQMALAEAERMKAAIKQAEIDAELGLLANQRSQERAAA